MMNQRVELSVYSIVISRHLLLLFKCLGLYTYACHIVYCNRNHYNSLFQRIKLNCEKGRRVCSSILFFFCVQWIERGSERERKKGWVLRAYMCISLRREKKVMTVVIVSYSTFYRLLSLANGPYFHDHLSFIRSSIK